jgi:hypothetical protein
VSITVMPPSTAARIVVMAPSCCAVGGGCAEGCSVSDEKILE